MSFQFPDPNITPEFQAANGIVYTWDATDEKWVVKAYQGGGGDGKYLPLTGGTLTGRTTINKVREDTNSIAFSIAGRIRNNDGDVVPDILLKSYQRNEANGQPDYIVYYGSTGGANEVLNRVTAQNEFASKTIVDDALAVQAAIQDEQNSQAGELVSLQNQIDELATEKGTAARFTIASVTGELATRNGEMSVANSDPELVNAISFGVADLDGNPAKEKAVGDIIELVDVASNQSSRFTVTNADGSPTVVQVAYLDGNNTFNIGDEDLVFVYPQNEESVSKEYVDNQLALKLDLAGGTMEGVLHVLLEPNWEDEATSKSYVDNVNLTTLATINARNYATETYVDEAIADIDFEGSINLDAYLERAGGTMTGDIAMNGNKITALGDPTAEAQAANKRYVDSVMGLNFGLSMKRFGNNDVATGIGDEDRIFRIRGIKDEGNSFTCVSINNESMGLYNVRPPEQGHHAANRDYVDEEIAKVNVDLSDYYTKEETDNAIDNAEFLPLTGGTLSDRLFFERRSGVNMIISPNVSNTNTSIYSCNGGGIYFRSLPGTDVNNSTTHIGYGKEENGDPATYIYHLQDPQEALHAANRQYVDREVQRAIDGFSTSERFYEVRRGNSPVAQSITFYEQSGLFYYFIDVTPMTGRTIATPANFAFKDTALPFKMGWIQSTGAENIMVSAVATQVRKTTAGAGHYFQISVDPTRADTLIHDPYTVPQGNTVVVSVAGLI